MAKQKVPAGKPPKKAVRRKPAAKRAYPGETLMAPVKRVKGVEMLDPASVAQFGQLGPAPELGVLGLVEVKFTPTEEAVLAEAVPIDRVRVLPTGQPYLPHTEYTRWFNRAFGRGGWALVPCATPAQSHGSLVVPYVLYIHGKPVAHAQGEQDYTAGQSSKKQTYGEAYESTVASGLRRCAKHLGVGLELWDRAWVDDYIFEHTIRVKVEETDWQTKQKKIVDRFRRKVDRPLPFEVGAPRGSRTAQAPRQQAPPPPADVREEMADAPLQEAGTPAKGILQGKGPKITPDQGRRLDTIITNSGRNRSVVKAWLQTRYGYKSTGDVHQQFYDSIIDAIEQQGRLPL